MHALQFALVNIGVFDVCACIFVCVCVYVNACVCVFVHVCMCLFVHVCLHLCVHCVSGKCVRRGVCLRCVVMAIRSFPRMLTVAALWLGCNNTHSASCTLLSRTNSTRFSVSFINANGVTAPCRTRITSSRSSEGAIRNAPLPNPICLESSLMSTNAFARAETSTNFPFFSFKNRFFSSTAFGIAGKISLRAVVWGHVAYSSKHEITCQGGGVRIEQ
eukprot:c8717_g1_i2.p1 GENE.c8717_g1_i2~~c8717_g1_i2.p1  ORF type:complete len:217 (+),score=37.17 c8717_g1_i2:193-843(+)